MHWLSDSQRLAPASRRGTAVLRRLLCLLAVFVMLWPAHAFAEDGPVVVAEFQGAKKDGLRDLVIELLQEANYDVMPKSETPDIDPSAEPEYFVDLAQQGAIKAFVTAYTGLKSSGWTTSVTVREGRTGDVVGKVSLKAGWYPGLQKAMRQRLVDRLEGPLSRARPPEGSKPKAAAVVEEVPEREEPEEEVEPEEESRPEPEPEMEEEDFADDTEDESISDDYSPSAPPKKEPKKDPWPALDAELGTLFIYRNWVVSDSLTEALDGPLSPEHFTSMFGAQGKLRIFPSALGGDDSFFRNVGLELGVARTFVGNTVVEAADNNPDRVTIFQELGAGLRIRIPLGPARIALLGGVGRQELSIAGEKTVAAMPDVSYDYYRAGLDFGIAAGPSLSFALGAAYRGVYGYGRDGRQIGSLAWFPNSEGAGFDATLSTTYAFTDNLGLRLGGYMSHYAFSFNPDAGQLRDYERAGEPPPPIAGGATDLYAGTELSFVLMVQ